MLGTIIRLVVIIGTCLLVMGNIRNTRLKKSRLSAKQNLWFYLFSALLILWLSVIWWMPYLHSPLFQWHKTVQQGISEYQSDEYDTAVPIFCKALEEFPKASQIRLWLADCYLKLDNKDQAIEQYLEVVKHDDTGKFVIQARKALGGLGVNDNSMKDPTCVVVRHLPIEASWRKFEIQIGEFEQRLSRLILTNSFLQMGLLISAVALIFLFVPENEPAIFPLSWKLLFALLIGLWLNCSYYGRTYSPWYYVSNGWLWPILLKEIVITTIIIYFILRSAYNEPKSTFWLALLVLIIGSIVMIMNLRSNSGSHVAIITARTLSTVLCLWVIRIYHGLGKPENRILGSLCNCCFILIFIVGAIAIHAAVFLQMMPWLAKQGYIIIPQYFWEIPIVQWAMQILPKIV